MTHKSCTQITAKIERPGYAKKRARYLAGFLQAGRVRVAGKTRVAPVPVHVHNNTISTCTTGPAPAGIYYAPFGIHRQTPVC